MQLCEQLALELGVGTDMKQVDNNCIFFYLAGILV